MALRDVVMNSVILTLGKYKNFMKIGVSGYLYETILTSMRTNRRKFFQTMGAGAAGLSLASALPLSSCTNSAGINKFGEEDGQILFIGDDIAVADTIYGKVQGFISNYVYHFRGIPYGADTSGKNRFMPPQKPEPWADIFPAVWWGNSAPQILDRQFSRPFGSFADHWNYDAVSEDCLRLNVWTTGLGEGGKRPVIVWLHGGGFSSGNGIEQDGYKGENLSKEGDIVFVSVNHRLGAIGFSDLSGAGGTKYADSGNVGALDMIAALADMLLLLMGRTFPKVFSFLMVTAYLQMYR